MNVVWHSLVWRDKSFQESMVYSPKLKRQVQSLVTSLSSSVLLADTVRAGQFLADLPHPNKILYLEDLFSIRYRRTLETLVRFPDSEMDVLGRFSAFVPR